MLCQPHSAIVHSGVPASYSSEKVCRPVGSTLNAKRPLPTESGESGSNVFITTLCRETRAWRSIGCVVCAWAMRAMAKRTIVNGIERFMMFLVPSPSGRGGEYERGGMRAEG